MDLLLTMDEVEFSALYHNDLYTFISYGLQSVAIDCVAFNMASVELESFWIEQNIYIYTVVPNNILLSASAVLFQSSRRVR